MARTARPLPRRWRRGNLNVPAQPWQTLTQTMWSRCMTQSPGRTSTCSLVRTANPRVSHRCSPRPPSPVAGVGVGGHFSKRLRAWQAWRFWFGRRSRGGCMCTGLSVCRVRRAVASGDMCAHVCAVRAVLPLLSVTARAVSARRVPRHTRSPSLDPLACLRQCLL